LGRRVARGRGDDHHVDRSLDRLGRLGLMSGTSGCRFPSKGHGQSRAPVAAPAVVGAGNRVLAKTARVDEAVSWCVEAPRIVPSASTAASVALVVFLPDEPSILWRAPHGHPSAGWQACRAPAAGSLVTRARPTTAGRSSMACALAPAVHRLQDIQLRQRRHLAGPRLRGTNARERRCLRRDCMYFPMPRGGRLGESVDDAGGPTS
jgi:hypothetical protein